MSPKNRGSKYARAARRRNARSGGGSNRTWWIVILVIVAVGVALVVATMGGSSSTTAIKGRKPAPVGLVQKVASVPASVNEKIGAGTAPMVVKLTGATESATPDVYYIGAEYCPYCAAERWSILNALSRFGTFSGVNITTSGPAPEAFPDTATLSFYQSKYTSKYLKFGMAEVETNAGKPLEQPSAEQLPIWQANGQGYPFINFSGKYKLNGTYDPGVLAGKTHDQIATAMSDPKSEIAKGAIGGANVLTATICKLTNDQPANVCTASIKKLEAQLP